MTNPPPPNDPSAQRSFSGQAAPGTSPSSALPQLFVIGAWVLIAFSVALVATSAAPAVARELGLTEVRVVRRDFERRAPVGQAGVDAVRDFERDIGESLERLERLPEPLERADGEDRLQIVETKRALVLRTRPDARADKAALVKPGSALVIMRRQGNWMQVFAQLGEEPMQSGWVEVRDLELP